MAAAAAASAAAATAASVAADAVLTMDEESDGDTPGNSTAKERQGSSSRGAGAPETVCQGSPDSEASGRDAQEENANAIFPTAEAFREAADGYFADCDDCGRLYGEAGLCLWLSAHNRAGRRVTQETLRRWYDGERCAYLQEDVQMAYLRIQDQVETDPRYHNKAMVTRAIFLQKQTRLGGYQDKIEEKSDTTVRIVFGDGVSAETFG